VPTWLRIVSLLLVVGVVVALAFTVWRLLANLKAVLASVNRLNAELTPTLEALTRQADEIASKAAKLQRRTEA
jgi:uncharacterized protein YoxC